MDDRRVVHNVINASVAGSVLQTGNVQQLAMSWEQRPEQLPVPRQLPPGIRDFTGRADHLDALDALVSGEPEAGALAIVVVDGPAGVGKTTLAVQWAHRAQHRFHDGTLFANLRGHGPSAPVDPLVLLGEFLRVLGIADDRIPADPDAQVALYRSLLAARRVLILLDDAASPAQVRPLLPGTQNCPVVVTSRSRLTGLAIAEAAVRIPLDLFTQAEGEDLVRGIVGDRRTDAEPDALAELVRICVRLPLALRIVGSRITTRPSVRIADVIDEVSDDQDRLETLSRSGDSRSALRDLFDWSYARLPAGQARMFRMLGLHPGPEFGTHAAAAIAGVDVTTTHRLLEALADVHLVEPVGLNRYRMHDLLNAYAAERARSNETASGLRQSRADVFTWYAHAAAMADGLVFPGSTPPETGLGPTAVPVPLANRSQALSWLNTEQTSVLTAIACAGRHGMHQHTIALACTVRSLTLRRRALWTARLDAESLGLNAARACGNRAAEAFLLMRRGDSYQQLGFWPESDTDFMAELDLAAVLGDQDRMGEALCGLGRGHKLRQQYSEAWDYYQRALRVVRAAHNGLAEAVVECNLSQICVHLGQHRRALIHARRELFLRRQANDRVGEAYALWDAAVAWQGFNGHEAAIELSELAAAMFRELGVSEEFLALALETAATSLEITGKLPEAMRYLREASTLLTELGDPRAATMRNRLLELESRHRPEDYG